MRFYRLLSALLLTLSAGLPAATSASYGRYALLAGSGDPAYADGASLQAAFRQPSGLAVSKDGRSLYVADKGNHALRKLSLGGAPKVETLAGGPGKAALLSPTALALSQEGAKLFIALEGAPLLLFDLPSGVLSAAPGILSRCAASAVAAHASADRIFALDAQARLLYISDPRGNGAVLPLEDGALELQGSLAAGPSGLYLLQSGSGELFRFSVKELPPLEQADLSALAGRKASWERMTSFGKGAKGLGFAGQRLWVWDEGKACFHVFNPEQGAWKDYALRDSGGRVLLPLQPEASLPGEPDKRAEATLRPLLRGPVALAFDPTRGCAYAAELGGNRVLSLQLPDWDLRREDGMPEYSLGEKQPGVTRLLVLGDSMATSIDDQAGEKHSVEGGFGKRLELYLNALASLKGSGRRYEVITQSVPLGAMGGGISSYYLNLPEPLRALKADEVLLLLTYMNLNCDLLGMSRSKCPDDACGALVDPFFFDQKNEEMYKNFGPVHQGFHRWLTTEAPKPFAEDFHVSGPRMDPGGLLFQTKLLELPAYREWVLKVHAKLTGRSLEAAKREKQRLTQVLLPLRSQLSPGENVGGGSSWTDETLAASADPELERIAAAQGCPFINLTPWLRGQEPNIFPLVGYGTHHYSLRGLDWAALGTAVRYLELQP